MRHFIFTLVFFAAYITGIQGKGIEFHKDILDEALTMAKSQGKYVFIDTYAPWCAPCKRMNKVFADPNVSNLYNEKFINVKINMDGVLGKEMLMKYDVVWLPTMMILDPDGNVKYKIDKEAKANDMIQMANNALDPNYRFYNKPTFSKSPIAQTAQQSQPKATEEIITPAATFNIKKKEIPVGVKDLPTEPEKILYVYNEGEISNNPDILYHQAYLQMQILNPNMSEAAQKYLDTQTDWKSEKNINFIFDFIENVKSPFFEFFSKNLPLFYTYVGEEKTRNNLQMMVYLRLNNGYPRPSLKEATKLYKLIDTDHAVEKAYHYYLQRLKTEQRWQEFVNECDQFLKNINPKNLEILKESAHLKMNNSLKGLPFTLQQIDYLAQKGINNSELILLKCQVLQHLGKSDEAKKLAKKALKDAKAEGKESTEIAAFLAEFS